MRKVRILFVFLSFTSLTPFAFSDQARAKKLYKLCGTCHGANGEGNKSIAAPGIGGLPVWYVENQIKKFMAGARGLHPKDFPGMRMRPMAKTLQTEADIKDMAAYVASLKRPAVAEKKEAFGSWVRGEKHYAVCVSCHQENGQGNEALGAPPLVASDDWYLFTQLKNFKAKIRGYDAQNDPLGVAMGAMAASLDEQAMKDVVAYITTMQ